MALNPASIEMKTVDQAAKEAEENGAVGLFNGGETVRRSYGARTCGDVVKICLVCFSVILNLVLVGVVGWAVDRYKDDIDADTQARNFNLALVQKYYTSMRKAKCEQPKCAELNGVLSEDYKFHASFGTFNREKYEELHENWLKEYHRFNRELVPGKNVVVSHFTRVDADFTYAGAAVHYIGAEGKITSTWLYQQQQGAASMVDLVRKWEVAVDEGDLAMLDEVLGPDYEFLQGGRSYPTEKFKPIVKLQAENRDPKTSWTKERFQHGNRVVTLYDVATANGDWKGAVVHTIDGGKIAGSVASFAPPTTFIDSVKSFYDAVAANDKPAMNKLLAPNFVARGDVGIISSPAEFQAQMGKFSERVKRTKHEYVEAGPVVIAFFQTSGDAVNETGASVYRFEAGRIASAAFYTAEDPQQIEAVLKFYEGFDARDPGVAAPYLADSWEFHGARGVRDKAWFMSSVPNFAPPREGVVLKDLRTLIEQGDTVVSHFSAPGPNGLGHGAAVHRLESGKIVETRLYRNEPEDMLVKMKKFYDVADGKDSDGVSALDDICAADYKAWLNKGMKVGGGPGGEVDLAGFKVVALQWGATPHTVERSFIEQGDKIVSFYHESDAFTNRTGAAVHVFKKGKISESYFYNAIK